MNSELFTLLVMYEDAMRILMYVLKNAAYDQRCNEVATAHYKDMLTAITNCRKVIDKVLMEEHNACN